MRKGTFMRFILLGVNQNPVSKEQLLEMLDLKFSHEIPDSNAELFYQGEKAKVVPLTILVVETA